MGFVGHFEENKLRLRNQVKAWLLKGPVGRPSKKGRESGARTVGSRPGQHEGLHWEVSRQTVWTQLGTVIKLRPSHLEGTSEVI